MKKSGRIFCFLTLFLLAISYIFPTLALAGTGSGYNLPYQKGLRVFNIQGPFSEADKANHHYFAIDFKVERKVGSTENEDAAWLPGFVCAARSGIVVYFKDCDDGFLEPEANHLVLAHGPVNSDGQYSAYSWYTHLKQGSIPDYIIPGAYIRAGTIIGLEGHNGLSTGVHLHFAVTNWFDPAFMYTEGKPGEAPTTYQLDAYKNRVYRTIPFYFFEYVDVLGWPEKNCVWSENQVREVLIDPNEPQP